MTVGLARLLGGEHRVAVRAAEPPGPVRREVELGLTLETHSAIALPIPPAPPKPFSDSPAATKNPGTPGIGPRSGFASGVIASGWHTSLRTSAPSRNGNLLMAPRINGSNRS